MSGIESGWGDGPKSMQTIKNYWDKGEAISSIPLINAISDNAPSVVAPPSSYVGHQVADLDYLNQKLVIPTKTEGGLDLSLLTSVVKPIDIVYEKDELWDYQHLIIEIAQIIRNQKEEPAKVTEEPEPISEFELMPFEENS
jgi:hypothetical protein